MAYLPFAEEDDRGDEVKKALAGLAVREGKLNAALVRALTESSPRLRAAAAEALVQGGGKEGLRRRPQIAATTRLRPYVFVSRWRWSGMANVRRCRC